MNFFFFDFVHIHCDRFNFKGLGKKRTKSTLNDFDSTLFLNYLSSPTTTFWISLSSLEIKTYLLCTKSYIQNIILTSVSSSIGAAMTLLSVLLAMCSIFSSLAYTYCFPFEYLPHISSDSIQFFMFAFFCFPTSFLLRTQNKKQFFYIPQITVLQNCPNELKKISFLHDNDFQFHKKTVNFYN